MAEQGSRRQSVDGAGDASAGAAPKLTRDSARYSRQAEKVDTLSTSSPEGAMKRCRVSREIRNSRPRRLPRPKSEAVASSHANASRGNSLVRVLRRTRSQVSGSTRMVPLQAVATASRPT